MDQITVQTKSRIDLVDITPKVQKVVRGTEIDEGVCYVYVPHTTAGITINENADPSVVRDITNHLSKLVPYDDRFTHTEGNADAHIKSTLVGCSATLLIHNGNLLLGTWQGIFFCEFDGPRARNVQVKVIAG